jgi:GrpB-like predicted nucleotidyltransferase (UPF0157 family)
MTDEESLLAAIHEDVTLCPYDPSWPAMFEAERDRLLAIFPAKFIDIQHIGSTAVHGLSSKPVVDILAGVGSMAAAEELVEPLCRSGYTTSAEFNSTLPDSRWFMRWTNGHRTHHLHVTVHGGTFWMQRVGFRDALRADPTLAARYSLLKSGLATTHRNDREAYTDAKGEFIRSVSDAHAKDLNSDV